MPYRRCAAGMHNLTVLDATARVSTGDWMPAIFRFRATWPSRCRLPGMSSDTMYRNRADLPSLYWRCRWEARWSRDAVVYVD